MSSKLKYEDFGDGYLLRDIEEISKALYLNKTPSKSFNSSPDHRPNVASKSTIRDSISSHKSKKSSIWNWNPLKALTTHNKSHHFNCCFFLHVHNIDQLPSNLDGLNLSVSWERKGAFLKTRPAQVYLRKAEFEETLIHQCIVHGSRNGPENLKYGPKIFLIRAYINGPLGIDIGKHWIDLTRLLPINMEELEGGNGNNGKWTTSFKLTGKAKDAILTVSFGFKIIDGSGSFEPGYFMKVHDLGNVPKISTQGSHRNSKSLDVNEIFENRDPELENSLDLLYRKLDEEKIVDCGKLNTENKFDDASQSFDRSIIETIDVSELFKEDDEDLKDSDTSHKEPDVEEEFDSIFYDMMTSRTEDFDSLLDISKMYEEEEFKKINFGDEEKKLRRSLSLDDLEESIENDFLEMLKVGSSDDIVFNYPPESPRGLLLRQFEEEEEEENVVSFFTSKRDARLVENLETESLMHKWGLNEKAFENFPEVSSGGFGSPVYVPKEEPLKPPPLGPGLGPIVRTKEGGFLSSMNPLLFRNANYSARLIVHVSSPVLVPAVMGFSAMEILKCWARGGVEKMSIWANELMHLEDITGKTIQEIVAEDFKRWDLPHDSEVGDVSPVEENTVRKMPSLQSSDNLHSISTSEEIDSDCVSLENLVPMAITHIEGLLIEGLKIQSGMADQEAANDEFCEKLTSEKASPSNFEELVEHFVSLDEWMRMNSEDSVAENEPNEKTKFSNFTVCLKVQLRDPLRNNETVGSSMLALIKVEKISQEIVELEQKDKFFDSGFPNFRVSEVNLSGLNVIFGHNELLGGNKQQQSGSRWLLSSGIGRIKKHQISNSSGIIKPSSRIMGKKCNVLWSISSGVQGKEADTWDEFVSLNVHVRNPDIYIS